MTFGRGFRAGLAIGLGYFSVSFSFGIMAASGGLIEMAVSQLVINLRYSLMAVSLSQKTDKTMTVPARIVDSFFITDEIFGVCIAEKEKLKPAFMYGIIAIATLGWVLGTFLGAAAGELLPASVSAALGIVLYGMFIAIIVPPSRKSKSILIVVLVAAALSCVFKYLLPVVSSGFAVIICAVAASVLGAILFPREEDDA